MFIRVNPIGPVVAIKAYDGAYRSQERHSLHVSRMYTGYHDDRIEDFTGTAIVSTAKEGCLYCIVSRLSGECFVIFI